MNGDHSDPKKNVGSPVFQYGLGLSVAAFILGMRLHRDVRQGQSKDGTVGRGLR